MLEMRNLLKKKLSKKGFTLAELLVVVAILAVLVAVSIPIFTGQLDKARQNTDAANLRAAKAAGVSAYMSNETISAGAFYDITAGSLTTTQPSGYNEAKQKIGGAEQDAKTCVISVKVSGSAVVAEWVK